jgi:hypothetical protein
MKININIFIYRCARSSFMTRISHCLHYLLAHPHFAPKTISHYFHIHRNYNFVSTEPEKHALMQLGYPKMLSLWNISDSQLLHAVSVSTNTAGSADFFGLGT